MDALVANTALVRYLAKEFPQGHGKLLEVAHEVGKWLEYVPEAFPHYTSHTVAHSEAIIGQLSKMLFHDGKPSRPVIRLSGVEAYVLAASAYLHDAGMVVPDAEKAQILTSEEWRDWVSPAGPAHSRFTRIDEFRSGTNPSDPSLRDFLADRQIRFLVAEFARRSHHDRSRRIVNDLHGELGRVDLGDPLLRRTIADVCAGHGLPRTALEDDQVYPDRRDVLGEAVNVRLVAILLRIGDLLDMSQDRACPLAMSAASPLPADSIAHWTKYQGITDRLTAPDVIRLTVECQTQDEHRFFRDWCQWLVDEVNFAAIVIPRCRRHGGWRPPEVTLDGTSPTVVIRPAATAKYVPRDWKMELDHQTIFDRLVRDVYPERHAFVRELLQNALDATRCRLYEDLREAGLPTPLSPTAVDQAWRERYPIRVTLRWVEADNELSGRSEARQELSVDDPGVGMDEEVVSRYLLQVGQSYYNTAEFSRRYGFTPASRFGIGFLSVFAESDYVSVDSYRPSRSAARPLHLVLTGPRQYVLTELGERTAQGTRIGARLVAPLDEGELTNLVERWCKRVEFPVLVDDLGASSSIVAERPEQFLAEETCVEGGRFFIRCFPVLAEGVEGELYLFAAEDGEGETWVRRSWASGTYLENHPTAKVPNMPRNLTCIGGIALYEGDAYGSAVASRLDYRGPTDLPTMSRFGVRHEARPLGRRSHGGRAVRDRLVEIIDEHLTTTPRAQGEGSWHYRQRLSANIDVGDYWRHVPGIVRYLQNGREVLASVDEAADLPELVVAISPVYNADGHTHESLPRSSATLAQRDLVHLPTDLADLIMAARVPSRVTWDGPAVGVEWSKRAAWSEAEKLLWSLGNVALVDLGRPGLQATPAEGPRAYGDYGALVNAESDLGHWLREVATESLADDERAERLTRLCRLVRRLTRESREVDRLQRHVEEWRVAGYVPPPPADLALSADGFGYLAWWRDTSPVGESGSQGRRNRRQPKVDEAANAPE